MNQIEHIRKSVFRISQAAFAEIAGTTQASVSRWENGDQVPDHAKMARIRSEALKRGLTWSDAWFFDYPAAERAENGAPAQ